MANSFTHWLGLTSEHKPLAVGDAAPDVATHDEEGHRVQLGNLYGENLTFIFFYPKAGTPGCTAQACSVREDFEELQQSGVKVFGVSADTPKAQRRFKARFRLPFTLLADYDRAVADAFGVPMLLGMTRRQSFLIRHGRIVWRDLHASTSNQAKDVLRALSTLP